VFGSRCSLGRVRGHFCVNVSALAGSPCGSSSRAGQARVGPCWAVLVFFLFLAKLVKLFYFNFELDLYIQYKFVRMSKNRETNFVRFLKM
jgi:hypothetical protein